MGALKAKGIDRTKDLPWTAPFQPWAAWVGNKLRSAIPQLMDHSLLLSLLE